MYIEVFKVYIILILIYKNVTYVHCYFSSFQHTFSFLFEHDKSIYCNLQAATYYNFKYEKCSATKQGWLLNLCGEPEQWHLYGTYVVKTSGVI